MKTYIALFSILVALCGCGSSSSTTSTTTAPPPYPSVDISGLNVTQSAAHAGSYDLNVIGTGDIVTTAIGQTIRDINLSGLNCTVTIGASSTVSRQVNMSGSGCTLHLPAGSLITVNNTGLSCSVVYDSAAPGPLPISNG